METVIHTESRTWFDHLPTEIIFHIFDYLSNNDILYTFFHFNQRFNNLLLQNKRYLNYLELPTTKLNIWKNILSLIGFYIESLNINKINLSFPLKYFPNLKSIIISSSYDFPQEHFKLIFENEQFIHLHSFKIQENPLFSSLSSNKYSYNQYDVLDKVFNDKSSLKIFQCPSIITISKIIYGINLNLYSLKLILINFQYIFTLIEYAPNLKYLNIHTRLPYDSITPIKKISIKLKKLYLTFEQLSFVNLINFEQLINDIKQFSSSLTCLSLNLLSLNTDDTNEIPFNSIKLKQFLESMIELKQFHLYARLYNNRIDNNIILSQFQDQYWFDHNWTFGMHRNYFYTLPFHFDYLHHFPNSFDSIKSNNPEVFITNSRLWYYVKSIEVPITLKYNLNIIKELKMKMPKLTFIKFGPYYDYSINITEDLYVNKNEQEVIPITLDNVTTIECRRGSIENIKEWLIYALPNLKHLILSKTNLPSMDSELTEILNEKIQHLNMQAFFTVEYLATMSYVYFSNVQYIDIFFNRSMTASEAYAPIIMKLLTNFKNLQTLIIYDRKDGYVNPMRGDLDKIIKHLDVKEVKKNYEMQYFRECLLFSKEKYSNVNLQNGIILSILKKLSCFLFKK